MKIIKTLLFWALFLTIATSSRGQVSAGVDFGFPAGEFKNMASTGIGGSLRYDGSLSDRLKWTLSVGYISFNGETYHINNVTIPFENTSNVPVTGGLKYFLTDSKGLYAGLDVGFNFLSTWEYTFNNGNGLGYETQSVSKTQFSINPGIGYRISALDFSARYNAAGDFSYYGLRAAFVFGGGK
jgi:hypothetical protein